MPPAANPRKIALKRCTSPPVSFIRKIVKVEKLRKNLGGELWQDKDVDKIIEINSFRNRTLDKRTVKT
jgi:hypothetical protein